MNICILIGTFRPDVAYEVMTENIALIKGAKVNLQFLAHKLLEKKIIDTRERGEVTDEYSGRTADQRMDKLLDLLTAAIKLDGEDFGIFLNILKDQNNKRYINLAKKLMNVYKEKIGDVDKRVSINEGKNKKTNVTLGKLKFGVPVNICAK